MDDSNNARLLVLKSLIKVDKDEAYSNIELNNALNSSKLDARDSALASSLFYGVIERKYTIDYIIKNLSNIKIKKIHIVILQILRMGIYQIIYMDKVPNSAVVNESVKLAKHYKLYSSAGFINAVLREFVRREGKFTLPDENVDKLEHLAFKYSCPKELISVWIEDYGLDVTKNILDATLIKPNITARVNTLKTNAEECIDLLKKEGIKAKKLIFNKNAIEFENLQNISKNKLFIEGYFHIQDVSSQICCDILNAKEDDIVAEVCSAPGGKAFTIAQMMNNKGTIYCYDIYEHKINLIKQGAKRLGITNLKTEIKDGSKRINNQVRFADKVLCDVPCSGLGVIRKKPEIKYKNIQKLDKLAKLQYIILCNSATTVKHNGILIYSTCTINKKENNYIANKFILENKNFIPYKIKKPENLYKVENEPENQMTILPGEESDGFFISAFKYVGD